MVIFQLLIIKYFFGYPQLNSSIATLRALILKEWVIHDPKIH